MALQMFDLAGADERFRFSPYCWRVRMACAHKGLTLETIPWRFTEQDALPTPNEKTVPLLVDGEHLVSDSWKIAEYLDAKHTQAALFESPQAKAHALLIKYWTERTLHPFITRMVVRDIWMALHEKDKAYFRQSREKRLGRTFEEIVANRDQTRKVFAQALEPLRALLADQPFVGGAAVSFGDYIVFGTLMWARCASDFEVIEEGDTVGVWRQRMLMLYDGMASRAVRNPTLV